MSTTLQTQLNQIAESFPGKVSFYARHLATEAVIERGADTRQQTMSAGKVFLLLAWAEAVVRQAIDPEQRVTLTADDRLPGTGALRYCTPGLQLTLADLAALMMTHSDNVATNLLLKALGGPEAVNACLDRVGLADARCVSPLFRGDFSLTSPRALAQVYAILQNPRAVGYPEAAAQQARSILAHTQDIEGMSRHLPWSPLAADFGFELPLTVHSKSGQFPGTQVEAGLFITAKGSWVAAAMCTEIAEPRTNSPAPGSSFLADFGRLLYEAWGA